ncbi:adenylate/guanylate cyclase domain-containing protein [Armatimonas sp.]|uniref:CHASE2 domain-containing protein n=1 Tax=Armatimonas sp. TaxID=1872638 RepID=UPI00286C671D|nr:adenylate/guanylate cyclase domain-containing protein [Armatimonas sp.]
MDRRERVLSFIGLVAFLAVALVVWLPGSLRTALGDMEWPFYDWHLGASARTKPLTLAESPVVLVTMEDETPVTLWTEGPTLWQEELYVDPVYPLPRFFHADLLRQLDRAGAKAIGFDILFTEKHEVDTDFAKALKSHQGTLAATRSELRTDGTKEFLPLSPALMPGLTPASIDLQYSLGRSVRHLDCLDQEVPQLGVALAAAGTGQLSLPPQLTGGHFRWGMLDLPIVAGLGDSAALIRYSGPKGTFPHISYEDILLSAEPPHELKGKLVLVGRYSQFEELQMTPLGEMSEVEILANIAYMTAMNRGLRTTESWSLWVGLVMTVAFLWLVWRFALAPALLAPLVLGAAWIFGAHVAFLRTGVWWESATPLTMLSLAVMLATPYEVLRTHRAFKTQVSVAAARSAVSGRGMQLGTREVYVTVVFCDIRGFTSFCETHSADEVETMLQAYFEAGDRSAKRFGSELDKFMGDAILLYFFELPKQEPGAVRAIRWAWEMQRAADTIGIKIGAGIASGVAREGFIGTAGRMQRTVIGDVVNLASRLQEATKALPASILLSEGSFSQLGDYIRAEPLGEITVRGKQMPVPVFRPEPAPGE